MNQPYKATLLPYVLPPSLPIWGDLEGCSMMFEKYPSISPYTYCANNPMKYVDPTGMENEEIVWKRDGHGNLIADRYDNAVTLSNYLGISDDAAHAIFYNMNNWDGGKNTEGIKDIEGHVLTIPGEKVGNRGGFTFTNDNNPGNRSKKTYTNRDIKSIDITKLVLLFDSWVGTAADFLSDVFSRLKKTDPTPMPQKQTPSTEPVPDGYTFEYDHPSTPNKKQYRYTEKIEDSLKAVRDLKYHGLKIYKVTPSYKIK